MFGFVFLQKDIYGSVNALAIATVSELATLLSRGDSCPSRATADTDLPESKCFLNFRDCIGQNIFHLRDIADADPAAGDLKPHIQPVSFRQL
jgi:hypothetical protein